MNYSIFTLSLLLSFFTGAMQPEIQVIKTSVGQTVILPVVTCKRLVPASYTLAIEPDQTMFKYVKEVWVPIDNSTIRALEYCAMKRGVTYLQFLLHSNTQPSLGTKWFIVDIK